MLLQLLYGIIGICLAGGIPLVLVVLATKLADKLNEEDNVG